MTKKKVVAAAPAPKKQAEPAAEVQISGVAIVRLSDGTIRNVPAENVDGYTNSGLWAVAK